jgi:hypothetical protein
MHCIGVPPFSKQNLSKLRPTFDLTRSIDSSTRGVRRSSTHSSNRRREPQALFLRLIAGGELSRTRNTPRIRRARNGVVLIGRLKSRRSPRFIQWRTANDQARLDDFTETNLISRNDTLGQRRVQGEERRIHLMRLGTNAQRKCSSPRHLRCSLRA